MKYKFSPKFIVSLYGNHTWARTNVSGNNASLYSAGLAFVFPDLFLDGNEGGIAFAVPPTVYSNKVNNVAGIKDTKTPLAIDLYYKFALTDNISITPGGVILFNGNGGNPYTANGATAATAGINNTVFVGAIKTKFTF